MMKLKDFMDMSPENLAAEQFKRYKEYVCTTLTRISSLIHQEKFERVKEELSYSPAGDDMGCDNHFIDFGFGSTDDLDEVTDIMEVIENLERLKRIMEAKGDDE